MSGSREDLLAIVKFADTLPVAVWVGRAPGGEVVYVNREFEEILGLRPPEGAQRGNYVGPYGVHLPTGERYPEDQMPFERVLRSKRTEVIEDLVVHRHDGSKRYLRVFARPLLDDRGEVEFVVEAFTDKTREVEQERGREEIDRQLQAVRRLESIGSLAGGVAHDFNNLLAIVKLVAAQLRATHSEVERAALVRHLDEVADSAAKLTHALLGFARRGRRAPRPHSLGAIASSVIELAQRTFERRILVVADLAASPDVVLGDMTQLEQVVMNLVMNARDALAGAGTIVVRTRRERIEAGHPLLAAGDHVVLEVEDTGRGVDPAILDRVFEPYVSTKVVGSTKGTGLGLATVFGIATAHGGTAEVARTSPDGTTMRVWLPASSAHAEPTVVSTVTGTVRGTGTILVIDDEPLVLQMTARTLRALGYEVLEASGGRAGVALFRAEHARVAAVVLDMSMADLDGKQTFLALRDIDPAVRAILTTGYALDREAQEILDLGVRGFVSKPYDDAQLSQAVATVLAG